MHVYAYVCLVKPIYVHFLSVLRAPCELTLYDVSQALCIQQVLEASHLFFQLTHQTVVGVLIDHSIAADLFGTISVPGGAEVTEVRKPHIFLRCYTITAKRERISRQL